MSDDRLAVIELSTTLAPAEFFTVDGEEYHLLGLDHLSADEEARVMGLFARFRHLSDKYEETGDEAKGKEIGGALIVQRLKILTSLTDMPMDVAKKLPVSAQAKLMKKLEKDADAATGGDDDAA